MCYILKRYLYPGFFVLGLILLLFKIRPLFQPPIMFLLARLDNIGALIVLLLMAIVLGVLVWWVIRRSGHYTELETPTVIGTMFFVGLIVPTILLVSGLRHNSIYDEVVVNSTEIAQPLNTTAFSWYSYEVAQNKLAREIHDPALAVSDVDSVVTDGQIAWQAPRVPSGLLSYFYKQADGVICLGNNGKSNTVPSVQVVGEGMGLSDSVWWRMVKKRYFAEYDDGYYLEDDAGALWYVAPYTTYRLGFPIIPQWGGVMIVSVRTGKVYDLDPVESTPLRGIGAQYLVPKSLARKWIASFEFNSLLDYVLGNTRTIIPQISYSTDKMPYLLPVSDERLTWFAVSMSELHQRNVVYRMFWVDAYSGDITTLTVPIDTVLIGPNEARQRAIDELTAVRLSSLLALNSKSTSTQERFGSITTTRPIIADDVLYWQVVVTDSSYTEVYANALVNTQNGEVHLCSLPEELDRFLIDGGGCVLVQDVQKALSPGRIPNPKGISKMTDEELLQLVEDALAELQKRHKQ